MDDALSLSRSQGEESQAARMIYSTAGLYGSFIRYGAAAGSRGHGVMGPQGRLWGHGVGCGVMRSSMGSAVGPRGSYVGPWVFYGAMVLLRGPEAPMWGRGVPMWGHEVIYGATGRSVGPWCFYVALG